VVYVNGRGFAANETVSLHFGFHPFGTATTDSTGSFRRSVHIFSTALPGEHRIRATGETSGVTATTSFLVNTNWSQFRGDPQHHGQNRHENVLSTRTRSIAKLWSFQTGDAVLSSPAVANGVVYVGSYDHNLYALDAATGAKRWSFRTGSVVVSPPAVANGVVYVGSWDGNVYALDAATGAKRWSFRIGGGPVYSSPTVANGVVYVGSSDGNVFALHPA
jgi:outer membrane protein assembly factor BamB